MLRAGAAGVAGLARNLGRSLCLPPVRIPHQRQVQHHLSPSVMMVVRSHTVGSSQVAAATQGGAKDAGGQSGDGRASHTTSAIDSVGAAADELDIEEEDMEQMFIRGPDGSMEYGGPTRGGRYKEPTRFGDWERKGRCSDF